MRLRTRIARLGRVAYIATALGVYASLALMNVPSSAWGASGPVNTSYPTISGVAAVQETLTANPGAWTDLPPAPAFSYQWRRCPAPGYKDSVLIDSPLAYWRLGDLTGPIAADSSSAGSYSGTYSASVIHGVPGALPGDADAASSFTGTTAYVSLPTSSIPSGKIVTLEAWAEATNATNGALISGTQGPGFSGGVQLKVVAGVIVFEVTQPGLPANTISGPSVDDGQWHHYAGTYDGSAMKLFRDGALVGTKTLALTVNLGTPAAAAIGENTVDGSYFSGLIDEAATYATALSDDAIAAHFDYGIPPCADILGANQQTYTLTGADYGQEISVRVIAANSSGSATAGSQSTGAVGEPASSPDASGFDWFHSDYDSQTIGAFSAFPLYWDGPSFQGSPLTVISRRLDSADPSEPITANYVSFIYGDCNGSNDVGCVAPLEIQVWPCWARRPSAYTIGGDPMPYTTMNLRGGQAALYDEDRLELYTQDLAIVLFGTDTTQLQQAASALVPANGLATVAMASNGVLDPTGPLPAATTPTDSTKAACDAATGTQ